MLSVVIAHAIAGGIASYKVTGSPSLSTFQIGGNGLATNYLKAGTRTFPGNPKVIIVKVLFVNHFEVVLFPLFQPDTGRDLLGILVPLVDRSSARYGGGELFCFGLCVSCKATL